MSSRPDPAREKAESVRPPEASAQVLIAPDSFKGTLTAVEAAEAIRSGWRAVRPIDRIDSCPVADGGEGTLDALVTATHGRIEHGSVTGPLGQPVTARWGWLGDDRIAIIEMAEASGLHLVPVDRRDPTRMTSFGTGELIRAAIDQGARQVLVAIGGSATCDAGAGMAQALGVVFRRDDGSTIMEPMTGGLLREVTAVDSPMKKLPPLRILCDVTNPLCGERGAARVFAPQKGATFAQAVELDQSIRRLVHLLGERAEQAAMESGAGAAGGLGFGLRFWCGAALERGSDLVLQTVRFDDRLRAADLVITGEGRLDQTSFEGKATVSVARRASLFGIPTIAIVGQLDENLDRETWQRQFRFVEPITGDSTTGSTAADAVKAASSRAAERWNSHPRSSN